MICIVYFAKSPEFPNPSVANKYIGLRPRNGYYPAPNYYNHSQQLETPINQTYHLESKQKLYWWLWLLPIFGILFVVYWYWREDIDAFVEKKLYEEASNKHKQGNTAKLKIE